MAVVKAGLACRYNAIYYDVWDTSFCSLQGVTPHELLPPYIYKVQNYGTYGYQEVGFHPFSPLDRALSHR